MALSGNEPQPEREPLAPRQEYAGAPSTPPRNSTALLHPVPRGLRRAAQSQRDLRSSAHSHTRKGGPSTHRIAAEVVHAHGHARTHARAHTHRSAVGAGKLPAAPRAASIAGTLVFKSYGFLAGCHAGSENVERTRSFLRVWGMIATCSDLFIMVRRCLLTFKPFR